ncbi:tripartite tricarboxylate transporter TctB family protein [Parathalassolituus penaei]|uniref:Tripartite tricarboxylate transporter TctB family protein n=1 Tax=Parathalassolituus penaei TaxID=2997323 RepID=A0A9X3EGF6_9GAMM|nr:tripartite tricarboxylate transporter TctB family protein [Parathalassolituus penaei]MCY0967112.1 tripartite tricarboxylate transporter TctB family protein [Parathalassolituus penaei]
MTLRRDHVGGLLFLLLSVLYGWFIQDIALLPGDDLEPFHARTLPTALAWIGGVLSVLLIVTAGPVSVRPENDGRWYIGLTAGLLLLVVVFGLVLKWLGFLVATILFLAGGFWLLGERRPRMIAAVAIPFSVILWLLLTQALGVYLAPGKLVTAVLGG